MNALPFKVTDLPEPKTSLTNTEKLLLLATVTVPVIKKDMRFSLQRHLKMEQNHT